MDIERITRRHRNLEERRRLAEHCESSGLSRNEFARRYRISLSSLQRWLAEVRSASKEVPAVVFREVAVCPPLTVSTSTAWAIEIVSPDGITVRCREGLSVEDLSRLLRGQAC
jgi:transposase-like protein